MLTDNDFSLLGEFFRILGDPTRLRILYALEKDTQCVSELCATLDMSQSNISHQLRLLKQARLVKAQRSGKSVYYSLDDNHVTMILGQGLTHLLEINKNMSHDHN